MSARRPGPARLTLGPLLFNWPAEARRDFYFRIADEAPVDTVCLGEVVCAKRAPFFAPHMPEVIERLERAGKEVVHSTLALIMTEREAADLRATAAAEALFVEANDVAGAALLAGRPHAIGPFVNVYNEGTLRAFAARGAVRVALPFELPRASVAALAAASGDVALEVQVFGRTPLAISARCYHARHHGLHKQACQYVCERDPDGLGLETLDGRPFLAVNGTQTLSHTLGVLAAEVPDLLAMGIRRFRLSPHDIDMVAVAERFGALLDGRAEAQAVQEEIAALAPFAPPANGFWHAREGAAYVGAHHGPVE